MRLADSFGRSRATGRSRCSVHTDRDPVSLSGHFQPWPTRKPVQGNNLKYGNLSIETRYKTLRGSRGLALHTGWRICREKVTQIQTPTHTVGSARRLLYSCWQAGAKILWTFLAILGTFPARPRGLPQVLSKSHVTPRGSTIFDGLAYCSSLLYESPDRFLSCDFLASSRRVPPQGHRRTGGAARRFVFTALAFWAATNCWAATTFRAIQLPGLPWRLGGLKAPVMVACAMIAPCSLNV
jgi:hypothetical protein